MSDEYDPVVVARLLKAKKATPATEPLTAKEFLEWLEGESNRHD